MTSFMSAWPAILVNILTVIAVIGGAARWLRAHFRNWIGKLVAEIHASNGDQLADLQRRFEEHLKGHARGRTNF